MTPIVAIIGKPNTGKSTLFNRLIGRTQAVTSDVAGTTRDRIYQHCVFGMLRGVLVDTGGLEHDQKENIEKDVQLQAKLAIEEANLILFVVDARETLNINDYDIAKLLRKSKKPVLMVANKCEFPQKAEENLHEIFKLGLGPAVEISSIHNLGIDELLSKTEKILRKQGATNERRKATPDNICISMIGRPNVGKSSLLNRFVGENRAIVSDIPGTTRDTLDMEISRDDQKYTLIDTAGIRKRGRIEKGIEKYSVFRALQAIERSDVVLLTMDALEGIRSQDTHNAEFVLDAHKGLILVVNKIDVNDTEDEQNRLLRIIRHRFAFLPWVPIVMCSAMTGKNVFKILELAKQIYKERQIEIKQRELDNFIQSTIVKYSPKGSTHGRIAKIYGMTQTATNPPQFVFLVNEPEAFHFSYIRYLENELRKRFGFNGTPVEIVLKTQREKAKAEVTIKGRRITSRRVKPSKSFRKAR